MGKESVAQGRWQGCPFKLSWEKAGLLLPLDGSGEEAWAKKELNSDAQEKPLDADSGEEQDAPEDDFLEVTTTTRAWSGGTRRRRC